MKQIFKHAEESNEEKGDKMKSIDKRAMSYEDWQDLHRKGLGGSDVGAVLGLNPWKTPLDVYREKIEGQRVEDNDAMKAGRMLEDTVARWYSEETGHKIQKDNKIRIHSKHEFLIANIDRLITANGNGKGTGVLEVKTASGWAFKSWADDGLPLQYYSQIQHYFSVTGHKWGEFAVLVDGRDFQVIPVEYDKEFVDLMTDQLVGFWEDHIVKQNPPEPRNESDIKYLYPKEEAGKIIEATENTFNLALKLKRIQAAKKLLDDRESKLKESFKIMMADAETIVFHGQKVATFKKNKDGNQFNKDKFQSENPDIYNQYVEPKDGYRTFRLCLR